MSLIDKLFHMLLSNFRLRKPFSFERNLDFKQIFVVRISSYCNLNVFLPAISIFIFKVFASHIHLDASSISGGRNDVPFRFGKRFIKSSYTTPNRRVIIIFWDLSKGTNLPCYSLNSPIIVTLGPERL